jgi:hypothetical protein
MSLHRACCCGEPDSCCRVWCECPDEICISTGTWVKTTELYSCSNVTTESFCGLPTGTLVGELHQTIKLVGVRLRKVTNGVVGSCNQCCKYVVVEGEEQDGRIVTTADSWFVNCLERDGDDCVTANRTCAGTADVPLSGTVSGANGYFSEVSGELRTECCEASACTSNSIRAVLDITAEGNRVAGSESDCCTQLTTQPTILGSLSLDAVWECRHRSRWEGTCPEDLTDENYETTATATMGGCLFPDPTDVCPCATGQQWDYDSDCLVTQSGTLFVCKTVSESFVPILGQTFTIVTC